MAILGVGGGTGYPGAIDTAQTFINAAPVISDTDSRMDAEVLNDVLNAILAVQGELGIDPAGLFATVVARLDANDALVGVFGNDYQTAVSAARSTTTSSTFQIKTTLITPSLTGTYRVGWVGVMDGLDLPEIRLQNTTDALTLGIARINKPGDAGERMTESGFGEVVFTGASKTFELQFRDQAGGNIAGITDARIEFWRVA